MHTPHRAKGKEEYREEPQKVFLGIFSFAAVRSTIKPPFSFNIIQTFHKNLKNNREVY